MSKKDSNFFEEYVEKIVLAVIGLVSLWLFITRVLLSPINIEYDNDKFNPRTIDNYISEQAMVLKSRINRNPEPKRPYKPRADDFKALFSSAISDIDVRLALPQPIIGSKDIIDNRQYRLPLVGEIDEVAVENFRTVAYVPNRETNEGNVYSSDNSEPNDIDFVTVEAKFDVSGLYKRFNGCFAGESVRQDWRDSSLAAPIFAAVQLQRQRLFSNGSWSKWQTVPRGKIDHRRRMFEVIENVDDLPLGGVKVRLLQFDDPEVRMDLLQPKAYQIASAKEEWFPPSLHKKYLGYQKEIEVMARREAAAGRAREGNRPERRSRTEARAVQPVMTEGDRGPSSTTSVRRTQPSRSRTTRDGERERQQKSKGTSRTIDDIFQEFDEISITESTDIAGMDKPLLFWAHDDTVEPGNSYRYRIRLGVFNPIAGTGRVSRQDEALKDNVILWSEFSGTTETVDVPAKLYFFPCDIQEATKTVIVQVSKYVLGYWYSKDFQVRLGELVGKVGEYRMTKEEEGNAVTVPQTVDYTTGAVLVDIVPVNDWSGRNNLHANHFFEMLYSYNGTDIERLPIKTRYWTEELQSKFNEIKRSEREPKEPLRGWKSKLGQRGRGRVLRREGEEMPSSMEGI